MPQGLGGLCRQVCGRLDWAQPRPPRGLPPGKSPTVGPGCRGRCPGRWPSPSASSCVLRGLSCHMPVLVPAVLLQIGCEGVVAQGSGGSRLEEARAAHGSGDGGLGWPGAVPDFLRLPTAPPACTPGARHDPLPSVLVLPIPPSCRTLHLS